MKQLKGKRFFWSVALTLSTLLGVGLLSDQAFAQEAFYFYKGKKVPLKVDHSKNYVLLSAKTQQSSLEHSAKASKTVLRKFENVKSMTDLNLAAVEEPQTSLKWAIIDNIRPGAELLSQNSMASNVIYKAPFFITPDGKQVGMSHLLYVKLRRQEDKIILEKLARKHKVKIVGNNKFMPLWFTLSCTKESTGNALDIANTFYVTGEGSFTASEPDFLTDYQINCSNDIHFSKQWGIKNTGQNNGTSGIDIQACQAWSITTGKSEIVVAVIDQGIELNHPDIPNLSSKSYDTETGTSPSQVRGNHGTPCAGIIGASRNNQGIGVSGIAPNTTLMSISSNLSLAPNASQRLANGVSWAWQNGADIISNSWGHSQLASMLLDDAINDALTQGRNRKGCIVVFAAGNANGPIIYPGNSNSKILTVGAMSPCGGRKSPSTCDGESWWGSCYGDQLDVVAPGVLIPTTDRQGTAGYDSGDYAMTFNGTSSACPHVAGVAALILSANTDLTREEVHEIIESTSQKVGPYQYQSSSIRPHGTWHKEMGYGLIDAYACVRAAQSAVGSPSKLTGKQKAVIKSKPFPESLTTSVTKVSQINTTTSDAMPESQEEDCTDCDETTAPTKYMKIVELNGQFVVQNIKSEVKFNKPDAQATLATITQARTGQIELQKECTTKGTSLSGARRSCTSEWSSITAPAGFVFNEHSLSKTYSGQNGSSNRIDHEWDDYVELIPGTGLRAPRTLRVRVHARSPKCRGCRGWTKAKVTATYVAYQ